MDPTLEWYSFALIHEPTAREPHPGMGQENPQSEPRAKRGGIGSVIVKAGSFFGSLLIKQTGSGSPNCGWPRRKEQGYEHGCGDGPSGRGRS